MAAEAAVVLAGLDVATAIAGNVARCWADVGPEAEASEAGKEVRAVLEGRTGVSAARTGLEGIVDCRNGFEAVRGPVVAALWDHYLRGASVIQVDLAVSPDRRSVTAGLALPTEQQSSILRECFRDRD